MSNIDEANIDPYLHLGLKPQATEKDIKSAYRKKSLVLHPDKNPDNPKAAHEFHLLSLSYALLLDGPRRAALDIKLEAKRAREARTAGLETRKRGMVNDLVAREEAFKKAKQEQSVRAHASQAEASVQSEGRKMREAAEAAQSAAQAFARMEEKRAHTESLNARARVKEAASEPTVADGIPDLQRTLRLSLPLPSSAHLISSSNALLAHLRPTYGLISDCVILPPKPLKKKAKKEGEVKEQASAMVVFGQENLNGCWALWEDCRVGRSGVVGWKAKWAEGGVEPEWIARLGRPTRPTSTFPATATTTTTASTSNSSASAPTFSFDPHASSGTTSNPILPPPTFSAPLHSDADYESATLLRMRQAERERLEREIREAEEQEE